MIADLLQTISAYGDRGAVVPFSRVADIKKDMLDLKNGEFHTSWLDRMASHMAGEADTFIPSDIGFIPRSLISVVMPSPKAILQFNDQGRLIDCVLPPHYINWEANNRRVLLYLSEYLEQHGFSAGMAYTFPQKLLAVHCGLGAYGRNNICYNDEFGSYMQIMTYLSDLPCEETVWFPLSRMERCEQCRACVISCPTGAIDAERQLVNSDRCITVANESPGEFPEWLNEDAHNSITGCTKCQDCCPANAHSKDNIMTGFIFTEDETAELLEYIGDVPYSDSLAAKLKATGVSPEFVSSFPRNLAVLLQADKNGRFAK
jgi:epoxyqueuosine reductase